MLRPLPRLRWPSPRPRTLMASLAPLSLLSSTGRLPRNPTSSSPATSRPSCLRFYARAERENYQSGPPPPASEAKSFAVATGELFLGLTSLILRRRGQGSPPASVLTGEKEVVLTGEEVGEGARYFSDRGGRSAPVVEDPVNREVVWEQRPEDVEAEKERKKVTSPGFSFSAAGLLFPYHLGVAQLLLERGYIQKTTPLAGSSAGAIVCVVLASGNTMQEALKATKILAEDCRNKGTAFRLGAVLRDILKEFLPDDIHVRSNGRVRVAVTQLLWRPKGLLVDQFDSKDDLINAVITSSFIPGYLAPRPATVFRNRLCIDGGLTLFMPPTSASETVRICAFPASRLGLQGIGINPDCNPENRASPRQLFNWALEPAADDVLDKLYELGYLDADVWAEQNPVELIVHSPEVSNNRQYFAVALYRSGDKKCVGNPPYQQERWWGNAPSKKGRPTAASISGLNARGRKVGGY